MVRFKAKQYRVAGVYVQTIAANLRGIGIQGDMSLYEMAAILKKAWLPGDSKIVIGLQDGGEITMTPGLITVEMKGIYQQFHV